MIRHVKVSLLCSYFNVTDAVLHYMSQHGASTGKSLKELFSIFFFQREKKNNKKKPISGFFKSCISLKCAARESAVQMLGADSTFGRNWV